MFNDSQQIMQKINQIRTALSELELMVHSSANLPLGMVATNIAMTPEKPFYPAQELLPKNDFEIIKGILNTDAWPKAVDEDLICDTNNEEHKLNRATGIVDVMITIPVNGKKVLDYGCGNGHVVKICADKESQFSVGYDIKNEFIALENKNAILTNRWREVQERGPYDIIVACDVLDHLENINPVDALKQMKEVLAHNGKIFVRYHSFMSRHYAHLYKTINKAFVQLVFTNEELKNLFPNENVNFNNKVYFPIKTYHDNATAAGLQVENEYIIKSNVEDFFHRQEILDRILFNTPFKKLPQVQMEMDFVDHILTH